MNKIGRWIAELYYSFLWWIGEKDEDNDPGTTNDREKWTWKLRRQKQRMGDVWWVIPLVTGYGSFYILLRTWLSWGTIPAFIVWGFILWLWPHVLEVPYIGGLRSSSRLSFVAGRIARRFDVA